jgi:glycosyltransferase involved in cell wall biosynthesis
MIMKPITTKMARKRSSPAACTIIFRNYLSHARILAESFLQHHAGSRFYLLIVDDLPRGVRLERAVRKLRGEDLGLPYFFEMCFKYDVTELSTAVKPTLLKRLMDEHGEQSIIYFDPDILVQRPLTELLEAMHGSDIVLTPHLLKPIPLDGHRPSEQDILIAGAFNLGFIALRKSTQADGFLRWWEERLRDGCRVEPKSGLMTDQKWVDLVPSLFPSVHILRDTTYNVAYWNMHERVLTAHDSEYLVNGRPLAFFHFSGFNPAAPEIFSKHQTRTSIIPGSALAKLLNCYVDMHKRHRFQASSSWQRGYSEFSNGVALHPLLRQAYLALDEPTRQRFGNPFDAGRADSFLSWAVQPQADNSGLSPFLEMLYRSRADVATEFRDVLGKDRGRYLEWARVQGPKEMGYDPNLVIDGTDGEKLASELSFSRNGHKNSSDTGVHGVNVCGYLRSESGLGSAVRGYIRALQKLHIPLMFRDISALTINRAEDDSVPITASEQHYSVNLFCVNADEHFTVRKKLGDQFYQSRHNIGIWAWELPTFPEKWRDRFAHYDEIWVGTTFIVKTLAPVSPIPVVCVPPVLSLAKRGSRTRGRRRLGVSVKDFLFLFVFDFHSFVERKNPLAVIKAFKQAFKGSVGGARLVIKCVNSQFNPAAFKELKDHAKNWSITILDGYWKPGELRDLMAACDAYVSLHRSEGTGLTMAEAMALGKPVVATGWSGNTDFMDAANSYPIRFDLIELKQDIGPYQAGGIWADPSVDHAASIMQEIFQNRSEAAARGARARQHIETHFSEVAVAKLIRDRLEVIGRTRRVPESTGVASAQSLASDQIDYQRTISQIREVVRAILPADTRVLIVSKGDEDLVQLAGRIGLHFPQTEDGTYAGHYPTDCAAAIAHLEALRAKGANFLLFPKTAFWWFSNYQGLKDYLETRFRMIANTGPSCVIYALGDIPPDPKKSYADLVQRLRDSVRTVVPADGTVAVVSKGDDELLKLSTRHAWHFPCEEDLTYCGYHPANSADAIARLEAIKARGAQFLLFPATAFWWLDFFGELRRHLETRYGPPIRREGVCLLFSLAEPLNCKPASEKQLLEQIHYAVRIALPMNAVLGVAQTNGISFFELEGRTVWHLQNEFDQLETIFELERHRGQPNQFLLLPQTVFECLKRSGDFERYLETTCQRIWSDEWCLIYRLTCKQRSAADPLEGRVDFLLGALHRLQSSQRLSEARVSKAEQELRAINKGLKELLSPSALNTNPAYRELRKVSESVIERPEDRSADASVDGS